jgi:hypothetical protein
MYTTLFRQISDFLSLSVIVYICTDYVPIGLYNESYYTQIKATTQNLVQVSSTWTTNVYFGVQGKRFQEHVVRSTANMEIEAKS